MHYRPPSDRFVATPSGQAFVTPPPPPVPSFWLLVPGTIGLIGITELVGENPEAGSQNLGTALVAIPAVALGILVGTMFVRAGRVAMRTHILKRRPGLPRL
jgi:uncharacterized membrane protein YjjB (DUF3815 family)